MNRVLVGGVGTSFAIGLNHDLPVPFDWSVVAAQHPDRFVIADTPDQVVSYVTATPGSIGYHLLDTNLADPDTDVAIVRGKDAMGNSILVTGYINSCNVID